MTKPVFQSQAKRRGQRIQSILQWNACQCLDCIAARKEKEPRDSYSLDRAKLAIKHQMQMNAGYNPRQLPAIPCRVEHWRGIEIAVMQRDAVGPAGIGHAWRYVKIWESN